MAVRDAALAEWQERNAADNISVVVVQLQWDDSTTPGRAAGCVLRGPSSASSPHLRAAGPARLHQLVAQELTSRAPVLPLLAPRSLARRRAPRLPGVHR